MSSPRLVGPRAVPEIAATLRQGELVVVPGIGSYQVVALPDPPAVVASFSALLAAHAGPAAVVLSVGRSAQVRPLVVEWTTEVGRFTDRVWPGPVTAILAAGPAAPGVVVTEALTLRVNVPGHRLLRRVCQEVGPLVTGTLSASDGRPLTTVDSVLTGLADGEVALVVNGGTCDGPLPTVVDCTVSPPRVMVEGKLPAEYIDAVLMMGARRSWFRRHHPDGEK
jgi:L-threonylcarbamoyladenylate synthase